MTISRKALCGLAIFSLISFAPACSDRRIETPPSAEPGVVLGGLPDDAGESEAVEHVAVRLAATEGDRGIEYRNLAAPKDDGLIVTNTVRVSRNWLHPGEYRVTVHAQDSDEPLGAAFSIDVSE
jgi:hypothetical protein